jgi:hypothetical protein
VYPVIGATLVAGAGQVTRTVESYGVAVGRCVPPHAGMASDVEPPGVTAADAVDAIELPFAFVAITVNVVELEGNPVIAHVVAPCVVHDPFGVPVTV